MGNKATDAGIASKKQNAVETQRMVYGQWSMISLLSRVPVTMNYIMQHL